MQVDGTSAMAGAPRLAPGPMLPPRAHPARKRLRRTLLALGVLGAGLATLWIFHKPLLEGFARRFIVNNPAPSDALVLLLGSHGERAVRAAELYREGIAPVILVGQSGFDPDSDRHETRNYLDLLARHGVPPSAVQVLNPIVSSTRDEAERVRDFLRDRPVKRITVVTSDFHTARTLWIFRRVLNRPGLDIRAAAVFGKRCAPEVWYKTDEGLVTYVNEAIKTVLYRLRY